MSPSPEVNRVLVCLLSDIENGNVGGIKRPPQKEKKSERNGVRGSKIMETSAIKEKATIGEVRE